jgi:hypothetical protein
MPLTTTIAASPYGASASLNSIGQSLADAGAPYAPYVYAVPGNANGLGSGRIPPLPTPPGYVSSRYPSSPSASQDQGPYSIEAASSTTDSTGRVRLGGQQAASNNSTFQATAETTANPDGSVTVTANTGVDLLNVSSVLDIGNVSSTAKMTKQAGASPTITQSFDMGTVSLLGQKNGLVGNTLSLFGSGVPVPLTTTVLPVLNAALAPTGIKVSYLPATFAYTDGTTSTGSVPDPSKRVQSLTSAALDVRVTQNVKTQGEVSTEFILGRVVLAASNDPGIGSGASDDSGNVAAPTGGESPSSGSAPSTGAPGGQLAAAPAALPAVAPSLAAPASGLRPNNARRPTARAIGARTGLGAQGLYLVLVLAAAAAAAGGNVVRLLGVKLRLFNIRGT